MSDTNNRTNELHGIIEYIKNELVLQYPCAKITPEYFICAILDNPDCIAHKALSRTTMQTEMDNLRNEYDTILTQNSAQLPVANPPLNDLFTSVLKELDDSGEIVSSGHVLCLFIEKIENLQKKFKQLRVSHKRLLVKVMDCLNKSGIIDNAKPQEEQLKTNKKKTTISVRSNSSSINTTNYTKGEYGDAERYMTNLNAIALESRIPNAVERDGLYSKVFRTMSRCTKNNVILVGDNGVGKTAFSKNIANLLNNNQVPLFLKGKTLISFSLIRIIAGIVMRGTLDGRVKSILDDINNRKKYIVLIDDIDTIMAIAVTQEVPEIINMFNSLLSSPNVYVIATCSNKGYNQYIQPNRQLGGLMKKVTINRPSVEECCNMVMANKERFERFHNVSYTRDIVEHCVNLADKHIKERSLPDSAFDIIDEVGAGISVATTENPELTNIMQEIQEISQQMEKLRTSTEINDYAKLDELTKKERSLRTKKTLIEKEENLNRNKKEVSLEDVYEALSSRLGKKVEKLDINEKKRLQNIDEHLKSIIIGQDEAVDEVCRVVKRQRMKLFNTEKPAVLFFSGSTGTGKTYLAKQLAEQVFGDANTLVRLDMSEYADKMSVNKLYGSAAGYVGYEEGGILTEAIKNKGQCVLLLDEMEKANDEVFNVFLQVFDDGRLTDNKGTTVSFRDTIIIMTSNIGASEAASRGSGVGFTRNESEMSRSIINNAIKKRFKPEFLNRIDAIVHFNKLNDENRRAIIRLEIDKLSKQIEKSGYKIGETLKSENVVSFILDKTKDETSFGGRSIVRAVTKYIEDRIVDFVIMNDVEEKHVFEINEILPEILNKKDDKQNE